MIQWAIICTLLLGWPGSGDLGSPRPDWKIKVLSGRPDMVTGGDSLVQVSGLGGMASGEVRATLNGRDATGAFRPGREPGSTVGRLEGLKLGSNTLEITVGAEGRARLELVNHPITGPVFSGPPQHPFICQTEAAGLGGPLDADCSAKRLVTYFYKSTAPAGPGPAVNALQERGIPRGFKQLEPSAPWPADVAQTTTSDGRIVNFVVRRESGTINRAIYAIAFLHQPGEPLPDPWTAAPGWNGRLVYQFGGGCMAGYHQSLPLNVVNDLFLSKGYAVATASLNVFGNNCNDVVSAETMMMVKEYFIERFGVPVHTIGSGGSGGSMQQHLIAQNYPGLLDGIIPVSSFPDIVSLITPVVDCSLLDRVFARSGQPWTKEQKEAVAGFASLGACTRWSARFSPGWLQPANCDVSIPKDLVYNPTSNRTGARCSIYDNHVNIFGSDPRTGFARQPLDNVGVQYGLVAFNAGRITAEQFLDLNEHIGGYDPDGNIVAHRTAADRQALRRAYQTGRVNTGGGGLSSIPIIDVRPYLDTVPDIHDRVRSLAMRARLTAANGRSDNQVILTVARDPGRPQAGENRLNLQLGEALRLMDRWLDNIDRDPSTDGGQEKVARNKPPELTDGCRTADGGKISEPQVYPGTGRCSQLFPIHGDPRLAAGAPLAGDVLKCSLKPVDPRDYAQPLTPDQLARLKEIFVSGVCDYSRPGVEQQKVKDTWLRF